MVEGLSGGLGHLVTLVWQWAVRLGTVAALVVFCWNALGVLLSGGRGREAWRLVAGALVIAVVFAALKNLDTTWALISDVGQRLFESGVAEVRAAMAG